MARNKEKSKREIRVGDPELKAIAAIQKALAGLDVQSAGRVMTFCIDRARQEFERSARAEVSALAGSAAPPRDLIPVPTNDVLETVPA